MNLKEAMQYIVGLAEPSIHQLNGQTYSDKHLYRINHNPKAERIELTTLSSLIEYIRSGVDTFPGKMIIQVVSPTVVRMFSALDDDRIREHVVRVDANVPTFKFGSFIEHEPFIIGVQAKFITDEKTDKALLLKFAGTVESGTVAEYGDDGISQKATIKTGLASKGEALIPSTVKLKPYRTFNEVEQPASDFIFRMKNDKYSGVLCALFEADGGAWELEAMYNIFKYLQDHLKDYENFVIIY